MDLNDNIFCNLCKKNFVKLIKSKKQCKSCNQYVCNKCSPQKIFVNGQKNRICDKCLQKRIQLEVQNSKKIDFDLLLSEKNSKSEKKNNILLDISKCSEQLRQSEQENLEIKEELNKKTEEITLKRLEIEQKIEFLIQSFKSFEKMEPLINLKVAEIKKEVMMKIDFLLSLNEESRNLDDKIQECQIFIQESETENKFTKDILSQEDFFVKVDGKKLEENINRKHRQTKNQLELANYSNLLIKAQINELLAVKAKKESILQELKTSYGNYQSNFFHISES